MESQTRVSKRTPREFPKLESARKSANPLPTPRQPFANPSPTFRQPLANLLYQPLSNPLFPWAPGTRLETRVNGVLGSASSKPTTELAQPRLSRVTGWSSPARGCKFGCVCSYMGGHYPGILMTGHAGANRPKFAPPAWGRPPFNPYSNGVVQIRLWVWSSLRFAGVAMWRSDVLSQNSWTKDWKRGGQSRSASRAHTRSVMQQHAS